MLIEAIIAAAIVALALAGTFEVVSDNAVRERMTDARRVALLVAQSALADVGEEIPVHVGQSAGTSGALIWRIAIAPYGDEDRSNRLGELVQVTVRVAPRTGGPPLATLRTLRLMRHG